MYFLRIADRAEGFEDEEPVVRVVEVDLVNGPPRDDQVVALA